MQDRFRSLIDLLIQDFEGQLDVSRQSSVIRFPHMRVYCRTTDYLSGDGWKGQRNVIFMLDPEIDNMHIFLSDKQKAAIEQLMFINERTIKDVNTKQRAT